MSIQVDNIKTIIDECRKPMLPKEAVPGGKPFAFVPQGFSLLDLEALGPAPGRKTGKVLLTNVESFIEYVQKHGSGDQTTIYIELDAEASQFSMTAIINDHGSNTPSWRDHVAVFSPALTVEWKRWLSNNGKVMSQLEMGCWLEDNSADVSSAENMPTGAELLKMALDFSYNSDRCLKRRTNLTSGKTTVLEFSESPDEATIARMQIFDRFVLAMPVFRGTRGASPMTARLRFREKDGKLTFFYELVRPDRVFDAAVGDMIDTVLGGTGFPVLFGRP